MNNIFRILIFIAVVFSSGFFAFSQKRSEVVVLSTLHQHHAKVKNYSFETLSKSIEKFKPDVLAVELTPQDLASRKEQKNKIEYQTSVFPLVEKHRYQTVALEPAEPLYSELVNLYRESDRENREKHPQKVEAFSIYSSELYDYLFKTWTSPASVNSSATDALLEVKHRFQSALFGAREAEVWEAWNTHFLSQILAVARQNKGKRILVLVGVEHAYWLRERLGNEKEIRHLEAEKLLKD